MFIQMSNCFLRVARRILVLIHGCVCLDEDILDGTNFSIVVIIAVLSCLLLSRNLQSVLRTYPGHIQECLTNSFWGTGCHS